jgi:hypothetical protein
VCVYERKQAYLLRECCITHMGDGERKGSMRDCCGTDTAFMHAAGCRILCFMPNLAFA